MPRAERDAIMQQEDIFGFLHQSNISKKNIVRLRELLGSPNSETHYLARLVLEVARVKPHKRKRYRFLRENHPDLIAELEEEGLVESFHCYGDTDWFHELDECDPIRSFYSDDDVPF